MNNKSNQPQAGAPFGPPTPESLNSQPESVSSAPSTSEESLEERFNQRTGERSPQPPTDQPPTPPQAPRSTPQWQPPGQSPPSYGGYPPQPPTQGYGQTPSSFNGQQPPSGQPPQGPPEEPYEWDYNKYDNYNEKPKKKRHRGLFIFIGILVAVLVIGIVGVGVLTLTRGETLPAAQPEATEPHEETPGGEGILPAEDVEDVPAQTQTSSGNELSIPEIAEKVTPSVVGIMRYENTLYESTGVGSGFIVDIEDGFAYIVSNAHVVEYGTNFKVRLNDGSEHEAELVGADTISDIALLRMPASDTMEVSEIGDSDQLVVGELVVAIGNPVSFDFSGSVTDGIVSALNRQLSEESAINYIQTNAAINPGNSGGALVNRYGQVIGINTMKISGSDYEGIGFAIPMADAMPIIEELQEHGRVTSRPMLGITGYEIPENAARQRGIPAGLAVESVSENAQFDPPLQQGDIITHVEGERIYGVSDLRVILNDNQVGDVLELQVFRMKDTVSSEEFTASVVLIPSE